MLQRLSRIRAAAGVVALMLAAMACGTGTERELGVGVKDIATDVGLGIEDEAFDAAPANTLVDRPVPRSAVPRRLASFDPGIRDVPPIPRESFDFTCEEAGPFDFPKQSAPIAVDDQRPKEGVYFWQYDGTVQTQGGPERFSVPFPRAIMNVTEDPTVDGAFLFDMFQLILLDGSRGLRNLAAQVTTYLVITRSPTDGADVDRDEAEGIYIQRIQTFGNDENNEPFVRDFSPKPPVLLLPFPAQPGLMVDSTGVDQDGAEQPVPGQAPPTPNPDNDRVMSLTVRGEITGRAQVDACGERVDSWHLDGEMEFTVSNPSKVESVTTASNYDLNLATQFGGMPVQEIVQTPPQEPVLDVTMRLGQLEPTIEKAEGEEV